MMPASNAASGTSACRRFMTMILSRQADGGAIKQFGARCSQQVRGFRMTNHHGTPARNTRRLPREPVVDLFGGDREQHRNDHDGRAERTEDEKGRVKVHGGS